MKKQYAVLGLGKFGESIAVTLQDLGCEVVAVESDEARVEAIADYVSSAMIADVSNPEMLKSLGVENLDGVIVAISNSLEASVMATMSAKELGAPYVIAVARNEAHEKLLKKVGADYILYPEKEIGKRIARNLVSGNFADWVALSNEYSMIEIPVPENWVGKNLIDLNVRKNFNVNVVGLKKGDKVEVTLSPDRPFAKDEILIIIGANDKLEKIK